MNTIKTIDAHTMGEATRTVIDGFPVITGSSMMEKKNFVRDNFDHLRKLLMNEPRGHADMFGAILTTPCIKDADLGVIFMDAGSYLNMCGHGTIGTVTMAITKGLVKAKDVIKIESPSGLIECFISYNKDGEVNSVSFQNVPAFMTHQNASITLSNGSKISADIAFGGSFFAIVKAEDLGITIDIKNKTELVNKSLEIRDILNKNYKIAHPQMSEINTIDLVEITQQIDKNYFKNVVVFGNGQIDRSPCGTGTCAKMATLNLKDNEEIINESIIGSTFIGKKLGETTVGEYKAIIPMITGRAFITGEHNFILQNEDPFPTGFSL